MRIRSSFKAAALFVLMLTLLVTPFAGYANAESTGAPRFEEPLELTLLYSDNPSFPFKKDWLVLTEVKARTNVDLICHVVPSTDYNTKKKLLLNSGDAPDMFSEGSKNSEFALGGVMLPVSDYLDRMPNLRSRIDTLNLQSDIENLSESDGKLYVLPKIYEIGAYTSGTAIRVDLLEKYDIPMPESYEGLYRYMKAVKEDNPDCMPVTMFWGINQVLSFMDPSWNFTHVVDTSNVYYNRETKQYESAATSDTFREMLRYLNKLYAEGLMDPEIFTADVDQWTQKMVSEKSVVTWCWGDQIDGVNAAGRANNPDFTLKNIFPLKVTDDGPAFTQPAPKAEPYWGVSSKVANKPQFDQIMQFIDWFLYSEESAVLTNWGVEGMTFNVTDGERVFVEALQNAANGPSKQSQIDYGLFNNTLTATWMEDRYYLYMGPEAAEISKQMNESGGFIPTDPKPKFSIDDIETVSLLAAPISDFVNKSTEAFVIGKMDIEADWDAYVRDVEAKGMAELVELYNAGLK